MVNDLKILHSIFYRRGHKKRNTFFAFLQEGSKKKKHFFAFFTGGVTKKETLFCFFFKDLLTLGHTKHFNKSIQLQYSTILNNKLKA